MGFWLTLITETDSIEQAKTTGASNTKQPINAVATTPPRSLLSAFSDAYPGLSPDIFVRAPGRVNLLGGHVDMHGGPVINIAINREIWLAAAYGTPELVQLHAPDLGGCSTMLSLKSLNERKDIVGDALPNWALYPAGVAWALQRRGLSVSGINAAFLGNVPMRAGLSSSAAVEETFAIAWQALGNWRLDGGELAVLGTEVEREYIGVGSGIQDQFTCLHARKGHVLWLDCRTLDYRHIPLPSSANIVICDTNTRRELAGSGYTSRAQDGHAAAHTIRLVNPQVETLRDVSPEQLVEFEALLTPNQYRRARHVISEIARVDQGLHVLEQQGNLAAFGRLMNESYWSARDDYGSSSAALDAMWAAATQHDGCFGARYSGGGEAGVIVALVATEAVEDFITCTAARYERAAGRAGELYVVEAAESAGVFI
jgi:galactokinase